MDPSLNSKTWFYRNFLGEECGPYSAEKMLAWYKDGHFSGDLMVKRSTSSKFFRLSSPQCFTQLVFDLKPKPAKIEDTDMNEEYVEKEIKQESYATLLYDEYIEKEIKQESSAKLLNDEYVEKEIKQESYAMLLNDTWQESPVPSVHKKAKMEIGEGFFKSGRGLRSAKLEVKEEYIEKEIKAESPHSFAKELEEYRNRIKQTNYWKFEKKSDMKEEYVEKAIKQESSATLLNDTLQESPVPPVHKKAKMEIGESFFKSRRGLQMKLRDRRSSGIGSAKLEVKEEYIAKEIKAESPHSFAKELEEYRQYREYRNMIKQTNYWKFEKKSDNELGFVQYYVMCTACPLALKDDSIEQMIQISEFPRHVREVHGPKGLGWMNSAKGARGCNVCGASQVFVKNIKKHKKCIDQL